LSAAPLPEWLGVVAILVAAIGTTVLAVVYRLRRFGSAAMSFDCFATAGRAVPGWLIRGSVVNSWIWTATIMVSARVGFQYGVSGPLWYAAGASLQLFILAVLADRLQRSGLRVRTFAEFLRNRFNRATHKTLVLYSLATSLLVCTMATEGGAVTLANLTGVDVRLAALLIPLSFTLYTAVGGLHLTVRTDFFYLCCTMIGLAALVTLVWHNVPVDTAFAALQARPDAGRLLALGSISGFAFGIINFVAQLGTVLVDQTYWQRAIAARPDQAGYPFVAAGLLWLPIPLVAGTTFGVLGAALGLHPTSLDAIAPMTITHVLGVPGALIFLGVIFAIFLSSGDSSVLAVSTLVATDLYRPGKTGERTERRRLKVARISAACFGVGVSLLSASLLAVRVDMTWLFMAVGIFVSSAAIPVLMGFLFPRVRGAGALPATLLGSAAGITTWLSVTRVESGGLSLAASSGLGPMLCGNLAVLATSIVICAIGALPPTGGRREFARDGPAAPDTFDIITS
jgi:Na+/proline symporter